MTHKVENDGEEVAGGDRASERGALCRVLFEERMDEMRSEGERWRVVRGEGNG